MIISFSIHFAQFEKHKEIISEYNNSQRENGNRVSIGMRVNPEFSTQEGHAIYDPCAPGSRLGVVRAKISRNTSKRNRRTSYAYALRAGF